MLRFTAILKPPGSLLLAALSSLACASEGFPPGGPEDLAPPVLVESDPAQRAVNATADQSITLIFDEVIDDRMLGQLPELIRVNPSLPEFDIQLDETTIRLIPQTPMATGVTYSVTILPGLGDRAGNATVEPRSILFSVGGEEPITLSIVRAAILRDSLPAVGASYSIENTELDFAYTALADSQGQVEFEAVEYGPYVGTAWMETEGPDGWQMTEEPGARDSFQLSIESRAHEATYRIAIVDTTAPVVLSVTTTAPRRIMVTVDDPLAPGSLPPGAAQLYAAGADVPAGISLDSIPAADVRGRQIPVEEVRVTGATTLEIVAAERFRPGEVYRVELTGARNRSGLAGSGEGGRTFRAERAEPRLVPSEPIPWPP